ncbi:MAG: M42 family metallopeptidase [Ignisphaera sp.]|uniref:M42 family peptidase n=1 Tax=Ignisphaera aggregans TaxID=334771 RepID=A0A832CU75_9CREN
MDEVFNYLKKLSEATGTSGREHNVRGVVVELVKEYADKVWLDSLGNIIALKRGKGDGSKLMLAAHMDEIGLFISHIEENGFLRVQPIGGIQERALAYQRVSIITRDGRVYRGVIGLKPPHAVKPEEARQIPELRELFVDIGATSKDEVKGMGIDVGDIVVFDRDVIRLNTTRVTGKAFDDRVGLVVAIKAFQLLEKNEVDVYLVATVQEEVGLKGARTAAFSINPHVALALDVTVANDLPGTPPHEWCTSLGKGPAIKIADGRGASGIIVHKEIVDKLVEVAKQLGIPYQLELLPGGTTDASVIQLNREGVPAGTVSIPTRYLHSSVEVLDLNDVVNAVKLVNGFTETISSEWVKSLRGAELK